MPSADDSLERLLAEDGIVPLLGSSFSDLAALLTEARRIAAGRPPSAHLLQQAPILRDHRIELVPQSALVGTLNGELTWSGAPLMYAPLQGWCRTMSGYLRLEQSSTFRGTRR